ncbi:uncharacterized protein RHOBADRAFT_41815 [Rhodotorula graminis WP1]|uniref:Heme peroxidase n=1 Tax=Rhodotorula graminis (strain WP1) TaxID=578459 RepID=A0A194SB34_RHOGW|nr:uncharacterized protein RHOBADRAFT_41815 [Rhodotorula graminis WP1]KPV77817.1 hypothetical protein RHOBADRAFT_41815 [Rhodotorula graminis WP1]
MGVSADIPRPYSHSPALDTFPVVPIPHAIGMIQVGQSQVAGLDDRKFLLEEIVTVLAKLPPGAPIGTTVTNALLRVLWDDIPKPPATLVGDYRYREADGSKNNIFLHDLGKARMPYARSVPNLHAFPAQLPDHGVVWDSLLKRDKFVPHPSGISSLLFGFAQLIVHSIFQTDPRNGEVNEASSYLDLSPIYGNNAAEQATRIFLVSPSCVALAILFSRNHNDIAQRLFAVNEQGRYAEWDSLDDEAKKRQDNDLFNTARNVNCGHFVNVIFQDYIRVILNLNKTDSTWSLVPTGEIKSLLGGRLARREGNHVSVEFNILYRWHASSSEKDTEWLEGLMRQYNGGKPFSEMTTEDFQVAARKALDDMKGGPETWTFLGLKRTESGAFRDEDIVKVLLEATDNVASAFKARAIPEVMRAIDLLGMEAARKTFREFLGLKKYSSFEEWNPDKDVARAAEKLYQHVDHLELYPGLMAEEPKPSMNGSGLAPGYSISRAILSDAAALVRGDRFFTTDYNAGNLTSAMWEDLKPELDNGSFGGVIGKLLMRHFSAHFTYNSIYALFPFSTPHTTKANLEHLGIASEYDYRRPSTPPAWKRLTSYADLKQVLDDKGQRLSSVYGPALDELTQAKQPSILSYLRLGDSSKGRDSAADILELALFPPHWAQTALVDLGDVTKRTLEEHKFAYGKDKFRIDVVGDVAVPVVVEYLADLFGIPLKSKSNPLGLFTVDGLYDALTDLYAFVYLDFDPTVAFKLRDRARKHSELLRGIILMRLGQTEFIPDLAGDLLRDFKRVLTGKGSGGYVLSDRSRKLYKRTTQSDRPIDELAGVLLTALIRLVQVVPQVANVVDFFLEPSRHKDLQHVCHAAQQQVGMANDSLIIKYVLEAMRLQPSVTGIARRVKGDADKKPNELLWVDLVSCGRDDKVFSEPDKVDVTRDAKLYQPLDKATSVVNQEGESYNVPLVSGIVRELLTVNSPSRPSGSEGQLGVVEGPLGLRVYARDETRQRPRAFPGRMIVAFEGVKGKR